MYSADVQTVQRPDVANCSKHLFEKCILLMLQTVQRPYMESVLCWCFKLFKEHAWKLYSSDVANWPNTLVEKCTPADVANNFKSVFCWCYKLFKEHYLERVLSGCCEAVQRPCLKNILFWCCKLFKDLTWNMDSSDLANCSKHLLQKCILLIL